MEHFELLNTIFNLINFFGVIIVLKYAVHKDDLKETKESISNLDQAYDHRMNNMNQRIIDLNNELRNELLSKLPKQIKKKRKGIK